MSFNLSPPPQADQWGMVWRNWAQTLYQRVKPGPLPLTSYTVATLPSAALYPETIICVSNEVGGATIAFSDGTNWRRVQDRAIVS